jgi:hypothetical protein
MVKPLLLQLLLLELPRFKLWLTAPVLLLLWSAQLTPRCCIHHAVFGRRNTRTTTASGCRQHLLSLFLIGLSNGLHHSLLINSFTCQLIVRQIDEQYQALLQVDGESCTVQVVLLLIHIDVVRSILGKGVELPRVVEYTMISLLKIQELLQLGAE